MQVFRSIQDDDLIRSIAGATRRLVFVTLGVSATVAKALEGCLAHHPSLQIMIAVKKNLHALLEGVEARRARRGA